MQAAHSVCWPSFSPDLILGEREDKETGFPHWLRRANQKGKETGFQKNVSTIYLPAKKKWGQERT